MKKNILFCLLAVCAAAGLIVSCGDSTSDAGKEPDTPSTESVTEAITDDGSVHDTVPELDFGGAPFRTMQQNPGKYGFYIAEETGDLVSDALYKRLLNVEERINIDVIETKEMLYSEVSETLKQSVLAGGDDYDLILSQIFRSGADAVEGYLYDWNEMPYITLSQPWYTKSIQDASIGNRLFMLESDLSVSYLNQTWFILYNKTLTQQMDMENLYEVVDSGRWTIDYLYQAAESMYRDVNGNAKADDGDVYGFATSVSDACMTAALYYAAEGRMCELNDDATGVIHVIEEEDNVNRLLAVAELLFDMPNVYNKLTIGSAERLPRFVSGEFVFVTSQMGVLLSDELRNCEYEYGVLPLPKYDEGQAEYYTLVDGGADILTVPTTAQNTEMIGAAVEIMSAYSYNYVVPTYMDIGLEQKGTRDEESVRMLRQILDSRVMDFGYLYDTSSGWCMQLNDIMKNKTKVASLIKARKKSIDRYYTTLFETLYSEE